MNVKSPKIVVFASGSGSNFEHVVNQFKSVEFLLVVNVENCFALTRADRLNVPSILVPHKNFSSRALHENKILEELAEHQFFQLEKPIIFLLGYMRILTENFFARLKSLNAQCGVYNLHPANLDTYKGAHAYECAHQKKMPNWSVCVHECNPVVDTGKVVLEMSRAVPPFWNLAQFKQEFQKLEHDCVVQALNLILNQMRGI
jgi:phosphoribosylglycinamide formyltransferase 1